MILVHHLENSRSHRVLWLLEELGLPYQIKRYAREPDGQAPRELRDVHPLGKSPVIADADTGTVLAESGAIIEYLIETYDREGLRPARATPEHIRYLYWMHYAEGSAMPPLLLRLIFDRVATRSPLPVRPVARLIAGNVRARLIDPQIKLHLDYMEGELATRPWFAGDVFTAADIQMSFPLEAAASRAGLDESRPHLWGFLSRIHARPGYQRAVERGGKVDVLK